MSNITSTLDAPELLHLAIEAAQRDAHGQAIEYLKQACEQPQASSDFAKLSYFLGAEYAQIGMIDRAIEAMRQAVDSDPNLDTAHFQLGLLHLTSGRPAEASAAWLPLERHADVPNHVLLLFKRGLEALARDEFAACRELLTQGMACNSDNPALNVDMQKVLAALPDQAGSATPAAPDAGEAPPAEPQDHLFLSAYRGEVKH